MKLAISNIAWSRADDPVAYKLLADAGVTAIEVAPTRIWPDWKDATDRAATVFARELADAGLRCVSIQSLLYGLPDHKIFGTAAERAATLDQIKRVAEIAAALGAGPMVFGSPKNRLKGELSETDAVVRARDFFTEAGEFCSSRGVAFASRLTHRATDATLSPIAPKLQRWCAPSARVVSAYI